MERSCATNKVCHSQFFKARSRRCCSPNKTQSRSGTFAIASQSHLFHSYTSCVRRCDSNPPSGRARFHLHRRTSALSAISRIVRRQTHINGILIEPHLASKFAYGPSSLRLRWIKHLLSEALGTRYALLRLPRNNPSKLETQRKRTRSKIYFRAKRGQADPDVIDPVRITSEPLAISFRTTPGRCPPHQFSSITTMSNSLGRGRLIFAREVFRLLVLSKISHTACPIKVEQQPSIMSASAPKAMSSESSKIVKTVFLALVLDLLGEPVIPPDPFCIYNTR
jgi:hypothetical protein